MSEKKVRSRWDVPPERMSRDNIAYLMRHNKKIVWNITGRLMKRYMSFEKEDIYSIVLEGFYRAVKAYRPDRGKLEVYSECYCWAWANAYFRTKIRDKMRRREESSIAIDQVEDVDISEDDRLLINEIRNQLTAEENDLLDRHAYGIPIHKTIDEMNLKTRHNYRIKLGMLLAKIGRMT